MSELYVTRESTAVHEAGHAVVAALLGESIRYATIRPGRSKRTRATWRGETYIVRDYDGPENSGCVQLDNAERNSHKARAMIYLAACEAERFLLGDVPAGCVDARHWADAKRALAHSTPPHRHMEFGARFGRSEWLRELHVETAALVKANLAAVRRVADALLERETLSGEDVVAIVRGNA